LDEVNQLNEQLLERDLNILKEALLKSQNPTMYMLPQQSLHQEVNVESSGESESDQIVYFIHDEHVSRCPEVEIKFKVETTIRSIIDSGSEVNIISMKAFDKLIKTQKDIPTLPGENVGLVTAFGRRSNKIKTQALIEFTMGEDEFESIFLISSQLTHDVILGCQLLKEHSMNINFKEEHTSISYVRNNKKQVGFAREPSKDQVRESKPDLRMGVMNLKTEPEWDQNQLLQQLSYMKEGQRLELFQILEKYKGSLTSKPGKCKGFTYTLQVKTEKPI
jgi:hypothetical protein